MPPTLSVVIPCRNDGDLLALCLQALAGQTRRPLEVIVVDNGSTDATVAIAEAHGARVVTEPMVGIGAAAAAGYDAARGTIIARCDADSVPPPDWLERIAARFDLNPDLAALTGPGCFYGVSQIRAAVADLLYMRAYFALMGSAMAHWPLFGSNMAVRASVWEDARLRVHSTDPEVHDDVDLSFALRPGQRVGCDFSLSVGISPRALAGGADLRRRVTRALHTIVLHWRVEPPWRRWQWRFRELRRG
ncbi:glycosyltransferase family 2 protein [Arthrobacter sp. CAN_A1]|uniref:glycosyltransferase family 2 protein n=1 Tax=Arthrobacter sp. CAN_A1 TaxID=2787717 RepID=UPI001A2AF9CF